jgi:GTP-binding protein
MQLQPIDFNKVTYLKSSPTLGFSPPDTGIEIAFVGRSNAGKSSALNAITGQSQLARKSKTPGRTQLMNYFEVDADRRLVDLPGYGFADVPDRVRKQIQEVLNTYLSGRACLYGVVLMMDIRHPLTKNDIALLDFIAAIEKPVHILLTKCDKVSRSLANQTLLSVRDKLSSNQGKISIQTFSALKNLGIEQAQDLLTEWFQF